MAASPGSGHGWPWPFQCWPWPQGCQPLPLLFWQGPGRAPLPRLPVFRQGHHFDLMGPLLLIDILVSLHLLALDLGNVGSLRGEAQLETSLVNFKNVG